MNTKAIAEFLTNAQKIVIVQADNPDGDSLGSALALEQILGDLGKDPFLYCGVDIPEYLTYLQGWDRVSKELPKQFDASIIVDASAGSLFASMDKSHQAGWLSAKPCLVIDHHDVKPSLPFNATVIYAPAVATAEIIYEIALDLKWSINALSATMLAAAIMSDSLGLTSEATTARSVKILSELMEKGVELAKLEAARREIGRKSPEILAYKGRLLERVEYFSNGEIATIVIPWEEIEKYSHEYNPSMLVLDEMRWVKGVKLAIAFKTYANGKTTAKIRSNIGFGISAKLAEKFGGGGHEYASGFKITDKQPFENVKSACIKSAEELLKEK